METNRSGTGGSAPLRPPFSPPRVVDAVVLAALFALLAWWSRGRWADLLVDFGHELYIPWQLSQGKVLQRDIAYIYGPLSQYFNALLFHLFGPSLRLLVAVNLALLAATAALLHRLVGRIADRFTAFSATALFLALFGFSQYQWIGNYNYVCPFTHESTHGTLLALVMLNLLERHLRRESRGSAAGAGVAFGLVFLTRAEISLAAFAAAAALFAGRAVAGPAERRAAFRSFLLFCAAALAPPLLFLIYFARLMPLLPAFQAVIGSWHTLFASSVAESTFYRNVMGLDRPLANAGRMALSAAVTGACAGAIALAARAVPPRRAAQFGAGLAAGLPAAFVATRLPLGGLSYGLPAVVLAAALLALPPIVRGGADEGERRRALLLFSLAAFALALLGKAVLNVRIAHYGFYLAPPALTLLVILLLHRLPRRLGRRGLFFRVVSTALLLAFLFVHLRYSDRLYRMKNYPVGRPPDTILDYDPERSADGLIVRRTLDWMEKNLPPGATLMALPQGVILNYMSRRVNPTPYIQISLTEILLYGESTILEAIERDPPDYIAVVHVESGEFGVSYFGVDFRFGARIMKWVRENYTDLVVFGDRPLQHPGFGILLMERNRTVPSR